MPRMIHRGSITIRSISGHTIPFDAMMPRDVPPCMVKECVEAGATLVDDEAAPEPKLEAVPTPAPAKPAAPVVAPKPAKPRGRPPRAVAEI